MYLNLIWLLPHFLLASASINLSLQGTFRHGHANAHVRHVDTISPNNGTLSHNHHHTHGIAPGPATSLNNSTFSKHRHTYGVAPAHQTSRVIHMNLAGPATDDEHDAANTDLIKRGQPFPDMAAHRPTDFWGHATPDVRPAHHTHEARHYPKHLTRPITARTTAARTESTATQEVGAEKRAFLGHTALATPAIRPTTLPRGGLVQRAQAEALTAPLPTASGLVPAAAAHDIDTYTRCSVVPNGETQEGVGLVTCQTFVAKKGKGGAAAGGGAALLGSGGRLTVGLALGGLAVGTAVLAGMMF